MAVAAAAERSAISTESGRERHPVRTWLYILAALVVLMTAVGGATRLTGSGLSITEWRPVTGAIPPLSDRAWEDEFAKYRESPQYEIVNKGMTLSEFKFIYAWEWGHRQLGRLIGLVFFLPLAWFWWKGRVAGGFALRILLIGALGGLQAGIGWIMVASGLQPGMVAVAPIKLAMHLTLAAIIYGCLIWMAAGLSQPSKTERLGAGMPAAIACLVLLQIGLGGLVAGSHAGLTYNTWPLMDGRFVPPLAALISVTPVIENFVDNVVLVQFNHRMLAYLIAGLVVVHAVTVRKAYPGTAAARRATGLVAAVLCQVALGITTLVLVVPLWAGLSHQVLAMGVFGMAVAHARRSGIEA